MGDDLQARLDAATTAIRERSALKTRELTRGMDRSAASKLLEELAKAGFERTEKHVRVPLAQQIADVLGAERLVPLKPLRKRLAGVESADELSHVLESLCQKRRAATVFTDGAEHLTAEVENVLSEHEVQSLATLSDRLKALVAATRTRAGHQRSLWRPDVDAIFDALELGSSGGDALQQVTEGIDAAHAAGKRLVFLPELVRMLGLGTEAVHEALLEAASKGLIELRPESGVDNLSEQDAALCLEEDGTLLSYVRRLQ